MNQMIAYVLIPHTPIPPITISPTTDILQCPICKRIFKSKRGLNQHEAIIRKYNCFRVNFYKLPKKFLNEFKKILVLLIHRQLPRHFAKIGLKTVTVACTESQFFGIFNGHIHRYSNKTRVYKCIFEGSDGSNKLAQVFNDINWGTKYYYGNEVTSVVVNSDDVIVEENPLDKKRKSVRQKKSRYK